MHYGEYKLTFAYVSGDVDSELRLHARCNGMTLNSLFRIFRGVVPLRHLRHVPPPQYYDCGPDWPLLFKVHEI